MGDTARYPLKDKSKNKTKSKISNPATGLLVGTSSMVNEILTAISGLVVEPMKGIFYNYFSNTYYFFWIHGTKII